MPYVYLNYDEMLDFLNLTEEEADKDLEAFNSLLNESYLTECSNCEHFIDKDEYYPDIEKCEYCK